MSFLSQIGSSSEAEKSSSSHSGGKMGVRRRVERGETASGVNDFGFWVWVSGIMGSARIYEGGCNLFGLWDRS